MSDGLLDTNVFIHAQTTDGSSNECRRFLSALEQGRIHAYLDPLILHEMSYALPHYRKQMTRTDVATYLLVVLSWDGVKGNKDLLADAVRRWRDTRGLAFGDAYLAALSAQRDCPVYTKNVAELEGQGAIVPQPLPS